MVRLHAIKKGDPAAPVIKRKDRNRGHGGSKTTARRDHAVVAHAGNGSIQVGDIVQRSDVVSKNRYVVVNIQAPWIFTRRISGSGGPGIITFPSPHMLRKVS